MKYLSIVVAIFLMSLLVVERLDLYSLSSVFDEIQAQNYQNESGSSAFTQRLTHQERFFERTQQIEPRVVEVNNFTFTFCNQEGFPCSHTWIDFFMMAQNSIVCAIQDFNYDNLTQALLNRYEVGVEIYLLVDESYMHRDFVQQLENTSISIQDDTLRDSRYMNLMHHKFCVVDEVHILTGTANPTRFGLLRNDNVLFTVYNNSYVAQEFMLEFEEMKNNLFGVNKSHIDFINTKYQLIGEDETKLGDFEVYFCPHQRCEDQLLEVLNRANTSIQFATFVLTLDSVEDLLLEKLERGVEITGLVDRRLINAQGSRISELQYNFSIKRESTTATMHHKTFIVDSQYVVFGSMNPTRSGAYFNDEHIIVVNSSYIAGLFQEEFRRIDERSEYFKE